jgi:hypothetical protein
MWGRSKRLWSSYCCHRRRHKTHVQIMLELLARGIQSPVVSTRLMKACLKRHGIRSTTRLAEVLRAGSAAKPSVEAGEMCSGHFFVDAGDERLWERYRSHFGSKLLTVIEDAEAIRRHEFDLLGSGRTRWGDPLDWHIDPVSGYRWPKKFFTELKHTWTGHDGKDVKLPWELSRMQHLPTLGKAYRLTKDERYAEEVTAQISHWLEDNPCPYGINWVCAMDVGIRAMNIIWAYLLIQHAPSVADDFRARLAISLFQHGQFILFNLEYGVRENGLIINDNHYLTNVVALLHLGLLCPELKTAETWKNVGLAALVEEMDHQVHPDGSDFESSLLYHRLALELFVAGALLCRVNGITLSKEFWARLERMFEFVLFVTRPDGKTPQVGDGDDGRLYILGDYAYWDRADLRYLLSVGAVLFQRSDMKAYSGGFSEEAFWLLGPSALDVFAGLHDEQVELGSRAFQDAGLFAMRAGDGYLLACAGTVGTGGYGNHKHNDLLSFELYVGDRAFIVDPGTYLYTRDPSWRNLFRSTPYHNTVMVDHQEQNRFQLGNLFRMAADAAVIVHDWGTTSERDWLDVEHTGYGRLTPPVRHRRRFHVQKSQALWEIADVLEGAGDHTADWYFHFDHGVGLEPVREGIFCTQGQGTNLVLTARAGIPLLFKIVDGWVSRRYGHKLPAKILHIHGTFNSRCHMVVTIRRQEALTTTVCEHSALGFPAYVEQGSLRFQSDTVP